MGCTGSKTVAQEPGSVPPSLGKGLPDGPPATRPRLGRLSIAGDFKQFESMTRGDQSFDNDNGSGVLPAVTRGGPSLRYAYASQRGHYPDQPDKANQDCVLVRERLNGAPGMHLFGVLDGHGETGAECAQFARAKIPLLLNADAALSTDPHGALHRALVATNGQLHRAPIDDSLSGTTACLALLQDTRLVVANVGDSRAVLARRPVPREDGGAPPPGSGSGLEAVELTTDQTPFREDECERVQAAGARVLTLDQMEGLKDRGVRCWTNEAECDGDPPRLWSPNGTYPGTAFTRSIGDSVAEAIGVFADPELCEVAVDPSHAFLIVATDGVFEFVGSQRAVDIVAACADPATAVATLTSISYKAWLARETRTDDISVAVIYFDFPPAEEAA